MSKVGCVVNFAKGAWYPRGAERLRESLGRVGHPAGKTFFFTDEREIGAPPHAEVPYAFKLHAIQAARRFGHDVVLWADASVWARRPLGPIWNHVAEGGYFFLYNTSTGIWTSDAMLGYFGLGREEAMEVPMLHATFLGFDFRRPVVREFMDRWWASVPYFPGSWRNDNQEVSADPRVRGHRHDQSAASIIAWQLGMHLPPYQGFVEFHPIPDDSPAVLGARGL